MPAPISMDPPHPGDGSGICAPTRAERERREYQEAKAEAERAEVEQWMIERYGTDEELAEREPDAVAQAARGERPTVHPGGEGE